MRERKRKSFNQGYKSNLLVGRASIVVVSICLVFTFGLLYLSQSSALAKKGITISDLEKRRVELAAEKDRLQVEATRLQSIQEIQKSSTDTTTKFIPIKKINYLPSSNVAVK